MKKTIALLTCCLSSISHANELTNFNDIKSATIGGKSIRIVVDFAQCTGPTDPPPAVVGAFTPNTILAINNHLSTSFNHFTLNNPNFVGKPVYEFVKYTITNDNNVDISKQVLDAVTYSPLSDKTSYGCKIGEGARFYD